MAKLRRDGFTTVQTTLAEYVDTGVTSTELAKLDGVTATTTELNYLDAVTSSVQTQVDGMGGVNWSNNIVSHSGANDTYTTSTTYVQFASTQIAITPTNQSSRVMLIMRYNPHLNSYGGYRTCQTQIMRGNSALSQFMQMRIEVQGSGNMYNDKSTTSIHIDHPNTTSETTYYWQGKINQSSANMYFHHSFAGMTMALKILAIEVNSGQSINWT